MSSSWLAAIALFTTLQAEAPPDETPAERLPSAPPPYPEACKPPPGENAETERVVVAYKVTRIGRVERARVRESTNACFDDAALAAARGWTFEPRRVDGKVQPQEDLETTFTFTFDAETATDDFDARPLSRTQLGYPEKCFAGADAREMVTVEFDVSTDGKPAALRVIQSTNDCLNRTALDSIEQWRYRPRLVGGAPVERKGVQTSLTYVRTDKLLHGHDVRKELDRRLSRIEKRIRDDSDDNGQALDDLAVVEQEFGNAFSSEERAIFRHIRALARIRAHDFAGAIDDLRVVQSSDLSPEGVESVTNLIAKLEAIVLAQEPEAAPTDEP